MSETASTPCVICRRPSAQGHACAICERRMRDRIADVVEFYALAEAELLPGSGSGARGSEPSIGVRVAALDYLAGHDAVAILASWESEWREHYGLSTAAMIARPGPLLVRSAAFLALWLHRACEDHPAVDEFDRELHACWSEGQQAARMSPPRTMTITCVADVEDVDEDDQPVVRACGRRIPVSPEEARGRVQCRGCWTVWDVMHLIHVAITTPGAEVWADPEAAAGYFRVHQGTLRKWAAAGRIQRDHGRYELHSIHAAVHGVSDAG